MKFLPRHILILFACIIILHFIANAVGLYDTPVVWFDNVLHMLAGAGFGLVWLWISESKSVRISQGYPASSMIGFVLCLALVWELMEFLFLSYFTPYAYALNIYSPSILEASIDVISDLTGAVVLLFLNHVRHSTAVR
ncbi:MAG: hypothetical protein WCT49_05735 [Candidatus Paceibacterota bacterium]|jgi:hypothetical protein|nr:hypothetical protein [Candidatus Paceibacterota bacterium]